MDLKKDFENLILIIMFPILLFSYLVNLLTNMMCNEVEQICNEFDNELKTTKRGTIIKWLKE